MADHVGQDGAHPLGGIHQEGLGAGPGVGTEPQQRSDQGQEVGHDHDPAPGGDGQALGGDGCDAAGDDGPLGERGGHLVVDEAEPGAADQDIRGVPQHVGPVAGRHHLCVRGAERGGDGGARGAGALDDHRRTRNPTDGHVRGGDDPGGQQVVTTTGVLGRTTVELRPRGQILGGHTLARVERESSAPYLAAQLIDERAERRVSVVGRVDAGGRPADLLLEQRPRVGARSRHRASPVLEDLAGATHHAVRGLGVGKVGDDEGVGSGQLLHGHRRSLPDNAPTLVGTAGGSPERPEAS